MNDIRQLIRRIVEESLEDWRDGHSPPSSDDTPPKEKMEDGGDFSLSEVAMGYHNQPENYFDLNARYAGHQVKIGRESLIALNRAFKSIRSGNKTKITAYRAIPKSLPIDKLNQYDWITFSKQYAIDHGEHRIGIDEYRIIEQEVSSDDVWWDNNDINEWGYDPK